MSRTRKKHKRPSYGHRMGFENISTRAHEVHRDRKRSAKRLACRKRDPRKGGDW